ncbi:ogr/Delta-like zinc finger family protein [Erwinia tracheiphila]|nr:ogr/Delta-like zinc finger family protein [Erwinia tracheiphila]UIA82130.1 ogr/Delta-like zinc finger family protein [Erwinia tracheiphila]UIA90724.1 ogr/Delta-like zinc finger family protein [Erwinia tracheiphila]
MAQLKITCSKCGARMHIRKSVWKTPQFADLYCTCTNVECSETGVFNVTWSHAISPSGLETGGLLKALLERLRPDEKQMALDLLQGQPG